jgi:hypothetical protein
MTATRRTRADEISIREWAAELEAAASIARTLAPTDFLPLTLKRWVRDDHGRPLDGKDGRPAQLDLESTTATAAAAIMTGAELGLKPGAALRSIAVINNTPALSAITLRAILQNAGHDIWVLPESGPTRAIVRARRDGSDDIQQSTWTIDRAKTAGLYPGQERGQWRKNPGAMLVARATAEAARYVAADAILGIPYTAEELIDQIEGAEPPLALAAAPADGNGDGPPALAAAKKTRTTKRKTPGAAMPALPAAPPGAAKPDRVAAAAARPVPPDDTPPPTISKPQMDRLHASLRDLGLGEPENRADALNLINGWLGEDRRIESTKELTAVEARQVIDNLDTLRTVARTEGDTPDEPQP